MKGHNGSEFLETYLGEKTLQTNKWFLICSKTTVYAVKRIEFKPSGIRHGIPSIVLRISPDSAFLGITKQLLIDM